MQKILQAPCGGRGDGGTSPRNSRLTGSAASANVGTRLHAHASVHGVHVRGTRLT